MEQRAITQMEKYKKMAKADEKFRQAQAHYAKKDTGSSQIYDGRRCAEILSGRF